LDPIALKKSHNHTRTTKSPRGHQKRAPNAHYKTLGLSIMAREKKDHINFPLLALPLRARERTGLPPQKEEGSFHLVVLLL